MKPLAAGLVANRETSLGLRKNTFRAVGRAKVERGPPRLAATVAQNVPTVRAAVYLNGGRGRDHLKKAGTWISLPQTSSSCENLS